MDWSISLLLIAVVWLDGGVQRVARRSVLLRRLPFGPWRVVRVDRSGGWRSIGTWPSVVLTLVLSETDDIQPTANTTEALDRVRRHVASLRVLGFTIGLLLVLGAPAAASRYGAFGLLASIGVLLALGSATALVAADGMRRCGLRGWALCRATLPLVSPFSAPYAADRLLAIATRGGSPIEVARDLVGEAEFARWSRPHVFDALAGVRGSGRDASGEPEAPLVEGFSYRLSIGTLERLLATGAPARTDGTVYCPRCGLEYRDDQVTCGDCGGVALVIAGAGGAAVPSSI